MDIEYKINFVDNYGGGAITCAASQYSEVMEMLRNNPDVEDIWVEYWNDEEGFWEA